MSAPRIWSPTELAEHELAYQFLIEPVLAYGGVCFFHAKGGAGKSQLALTLAKAVVEGGSFLGLPCERDRVAYLCSDMGTFLTQRRIRKWLQANVADPEQMRIWLWEESLNVLSEDLGEEWVGALQGWNPGLVIVDTLRKSHPLDESAPETPTLVYEAWKRLVGRRPAIMFLHHDRKGFVGQQELDPGESFRGSSAWSDDADLAIHLTRKGRSRLAPRRLSWTKIRTDDERASVELEMDPETLLFRMVGGEEEHPLMAKARELARDGDRTGTVKGLMREGVSQATAYRLVKELFEE